MPRDTPHKVAHLTIGDVAGIMRCSTDTVRRHHAEWTRAAGFPSPVSLEGVRGLRWPRAAVLAWELQRAAGQKGTAATDWAAVAAARGALLDAGLDPDVAINSLSVPTLALSE